jgi:DNA-binding response OmpR family regulator
MRPLVPFPVAADTRPLASDSSRPVACPTVSDVLIATDADWIFEDVDAALSDEDSRVLRVRRGRDVAAAVRRENPGLVVLDMQIGNMGGIATALHLAQEFEAGAMPRVPVLLLLDRPADVPLARRWSVDGWLVKPVDSFRLRRAARALLAGETYHEPSGLAVPL